MDITEYIVIFYLSMFIAGLWYALSVWAWEEYEPGFWNCVFMFQKDVYHDYAGKINRAGLIVMEILTTVIFIFNNILIFVALSLFYAIKYAIKMVFSIFFFIFRKKNNTKAESSI